MRRSLRRAGLLSGLILIALPAAAPAATYDPFFSSASTAANFPVTSGTPTRTYGVAAGDFDGDGKADLVVGRIEAGAGRVSFQKGNGDGTFAAATTFTWRLSTFNVWTLTAGDVNDDGKLDIVWGANQAGNSGCSVSPVPLTGCPLTRSVAQGDVRAILGNGNGTFQQNSYFVSGIEFAAGTLLAHPTANGVSTVTTADIDGDNDTDVMAGGLDGANVVIKQLRNDDLVDTFTVSTLISQPGGSATLGSPIYQQPTSAAVLTSSPWGLAFGDADADGDKDLFIGDRALYVYLYKNNGAGAFTLTPGNTVVSGTRPNVYLAHENYRAALGFTPSLGAGDVNGDGRADLFLGLQSGAQNPLTTTTAHDGELVLDVSSSGAHELFGTVGDVGDIARGVRVLDVNGDSNRDVVSGEFNGTVKLLRQLPPLDTDNDGISDYVDNAPNHANAPRLDMNTDGGITFLDQLDNDFDTTLGDPENTGTWDRRGDAVDDDDDNDGVLDGDDNCRLVANGGQVNVDGDGRGDACDPLNDTDTDGDGVPNGPNAGDPYFEQSRDAAIKWSRGDTHFVIRIDALGRLFQNEFTGLMTDAAISSPETWAAKCQGMYNAGDPDPGCATLAGGKEVPVTTVVIPRLLWTDPEVLTWINDRNDNPLFEVGQHGTYHASNTTLGDWKDLGDRNFFSCELCGFDDAESYELLKIGNDTLLGHYDNAWLKQEGAAEGSTPEIDWSTSANPLISYAPPFNASDTESRRGASYLGFKGFSASVHEESPSSIGGIFSPEGSHHEQFDQFGMYHASADLELEPPEPGQTAEDYAQYLQSQTDDGGLTTWLIEEVEWSGRPCNELDRLNDLCNGGSNRENNTVYGPRWDGWLQLLDHVKNYPGGVAMTLGEVALAKGYDNAPTVDNAGQADGDHDGIGDVIEGVTVDAADASLSRNEAGELTVTLTNGAGDPLADQDVTFSFDSDGNGTPESQTATTGASGVATVTVTATRPVGPTTFDASWDGGRGVTAQGSGDVAVRDKTTMTLAAGNPSSGQVTDPVQVSARLVDTDGAPLAGEQVAFSIGTASANGTTDSNGVASATLTLPGPAAAATLKAAFAGRGDFGASSDSKAFTINQEDTVLTLAAPVTVKGKTTAQVRLVEADGAGLAGRTIQMFAEVKQRNTVSFVSIGTVTTGADGRATASIPSANKSSRLRATFAGDGSFLGTSVTR